MSSLPVLYDHPVSSFTQKVRIALREKGIPFTTEPPPSMATPEPSPIFAAANPRLEVPVFIDGDLKIFDSTIILEYLEDKWPDQVPLRPRDPVRRARSRMIEDVCDTHYEAINWALGEVVWMGRAEGPLADHLKKEAGNQTKEIQQWLTGQLGNETFFGGEEFGLTDVAVFPILNRSVHFGFGPQLGSTLAAWLDRVKQRPSIQRTVAEYEAAVPSISKMAPLFKSGERRREFRDHRLEWMIKSGGIDIVIAGIRNKNIRFSWPYATS